MDARPDQRPDEKRQAEPGIGPAHAAVGRRIGRWRRVAGAIAVMANAWRSLGRWLSGHCRGRLDEPVRGAVPDAAEIVRRTRRLRFRVKPEAVSILAGAYHGARPGVGLMFSELRAYEPGDDVRHLDWNVTARQGRPFVRRFVEERSLVLWVIVDVSASLRFGPEGRTKADRAAQAAALLATAAIQNGDRVGLILVSDRIEAELPPGGGPRHLSRILRTLVVTPTVARGTALTAGIERFQRRRGTSVVDRRRERFPHARQRTGRRLATGGPPPSSDRAAPGRASRGRASASPRKRGVARSSGCRRSGSCPRGRGLGTGSRHLC